MASIDTAAESVGFTEDHALLHKTARRFLAEKCPFAEVRRLAGDRLGFDPALYRELCELGWAGLLLAERHGGTALGPLAMALVLEECGRALLPGPLLAGVLAGLAIDRAGSEEQKQRLLPAITGGSTIATVALSEPGGSWEPDAVQTTATRRGEGYVLSGIKVHVPWAAHAGVLVLPARLAEADSALALFAVPLAAGAGITITEEVSVDPTRRAAKVSLTELAVPGDARLLASHADAAGAWRAVFIHGYALLAADMLGAAQAILTRTCAYANERIQFDRPIGSFQAVKHPLVNVLIALERSRSLAYAAASLLGSAGPDTARAETLARMAKAAATDALLYAADRGVQLHGGYGFTWDCDAHFFFKRALWSAATLGDATHHRRHLGAQLASL